jgi:hypothetical protein
MFWRNSMSPYSSGYIEQDKQDRGSGRIGIKETIETISGL